MAVVLNKGEYVLQQSTTSNGIIMDNNANLIGEIVVANDLATAYVQGDKVWFNPKGAVMYSQDNTKFYFIKEENILFKED